MDYVIDSCGLSKSYNEVKAVQSLNFSVKKGEVFGFLGPNGAGKTSTLRMLLGIVSPDEGELHIFGESSIRGIRHRIGYLPEERGLYQKMTVLGVILYFASLRDQSRARARMAALALLEQFNLQHVAKKKVKSLSKGMMQKVQLISTILHKPDLLVLDEPFSGLDPVNQTLLEEVILQCRTAGSTVIFSTHVMQHAERLCDKILILNKGKKVFDGTLKTAQSTLPPVITLRSKHQITIFDTFDDISKIEEVSPREPGEIYTYYITLHPGADPYKVLKACVIAGIEIQQFDCSPPNLHDIFIHLVNGEEDPLTGISNV